MRTAVISLLLSLCLIVFFQNCSPYHQSGNGSSSATSTDPNADADGDGLPDGIPLNGDPVSAAAFETTLFPILQANCVGCHDVGQVPLFLSTDPQITHDLLIINNIVSAQSPSSSLIVSHIQNSHQNIPVTLGDEILQAIINWSNQLP